MSDKDFLKLAQAMRKARSYEHYYEKLDEALQLLREIFNDNGGAERYLRIS